MGLYLLYDHFDHFLDELMHAQRAQGSVQGYVKIQERRTQQGEQATISTMILVTWVHLQERIIHAANLPVETITLAADESLHEREIAQMRERGRFARRLVIAALGDRGVTPDPNLVLLTAGLHEALMQLQTEQLSWTIVVRGSGPDLEREIVPLD
jgi:DNA-binding transcriptional MocR family regulator